MVRNLKPRLGDGVIISNEAHIAHLKRLCEHATSSIGEHALYAPYDTSLNYNASRLQLEGYRCPVHLQAKLYRNSALDDCGRLTTQDIPEVKATAMTRMVLRPRKGK